MSVVEQISIAWHKLIHPQAATVVGALIKEVLQANKRWAQDFDKPLSLGVKKKLVVLTCMDSRLIPEKFLGLGIGDAEIIRNGGGRVTSDVLRSLVITQDLLKCDTVLVIHHDDCGAQAAVRHHDDIMASLKDHMTHRAPLWMKIPFFLGWNLSYVVPPFMRKAAVSMALHPVFDLHGAVVDDVKALRRAPNVKPDVKLYGMMYSVETGKVTVLCKDEGKGLVLTEDYQEGKQLQSDAGKIDSGHAHTH